MIPEINADDFFGGYKLRSKHEEDLEFTHVTFRVREGDETTIRWWMCN